MNTSSRSVNLEVTGDHDGTIWFSAAVTIADKSFRNITATYETATGYVTVESGGVTFVEADGTVTESPVSEAFLLARGVIAAAIRASRRVRG